MNPAIRRRLRVLLAAFLPGALAGTQIAGLLFFLNPHLPFDPVPVLRGIAFFSLLLGGSSLVVLLPWTWNRPDRAARWLPWCLTLVLALAALGFWIHASYYAFFLPSGINRRLVKAWIWLSLAAVVCFYTSFLHQVRQRPYGRRSRVLFALLAVASIYVVMERREAFKPTLDPDPRATTFQGSSRPRLLVVGLEAATLDAILPLAEQGRLPFFNKLLTEGSHTRLTSLDPVRRKPLWTTLASGLYPFKHGIVSEEVARARFLGNTEVLSLLPVGIGFEYWGTWSHMRPIKARSRRVLTLWEILARLEISTAIVGWPLSAPGPFKTPEGLKVGLTDLFFQGSESAGSVWPMEIAERARLFRSSWDGLEPDLVSGFGPDPPQEVLEALAGDLWREDLTLFLLDQEPRIEAFFLVLPGLLEVSRDYFGGYSSVQFEGEQDPAARQGAQLVTAYYVHLDEFLAQLWDNVQEPRLLTVVSVHGVEDAYSWRKATRVLSRQPQLGGYFKRGPAGVLMLLGEGIRTGSRISSAELVDLVPTLLYGLGLPVGRDLDGGVLTETFDSSFLARQPLSFLPSYETFAAPDDELDEP